MSQVRGGLAYMPAAHHDQSRGRGEPLDEHLCAFGGAEGLAAAYVGHPLSDLDGLGVQLGAAQGAGHRAVHPQQQLGAQDRAAFFGIYDGGQADRLAAIIGVHNLVADGQEILGLPQWISLPMDKKSSVSRSGSR